MKGESENLKYIKIFVLVIFFAAAISIAYKIFISIKNSTFKHQTFNLMVISDSDYVIRINRELHKLYIVKFPKTSVLSNGSRLEKSLMLGVALDGSIVFNSSGLQVEKTFMSQKMLLDILFSSNDTKFDNINWVDALKIFFYSGQISQNDRIFEEHKTLEETKEALLQNLSYFYDPRVFNEKRSVEIINSTDKNGLGGQLAASLKAIGYNVVSVTNEDNQKSQTSSAGDSDSVERLKSLLPLPFVKKNTSTIADITIVLGRDLEKEINY